MHRIGGGQCTTRRTRGWWCRNTPPSYSRRPSIHHANRSSLQILYTIKSLFFFKENRTVLSMHRKDFFLPAMPQAVRTRVQERKRGRRAQNILAIIIPSSRVPTAVSTRPVPLFKDDPSEIYPIAKGPSESPLLPLLLWRDSRKTAPRPGPMNKFDFNPQRQRPRAAHNPYTTCKIGRGWPKAPDTAIASEKKPIAPRLASRPRTYPFAVPGDTGARFVNSKSVPT